MKKIFLTLIAVIASTFTINLFGQFGQNIKFSCGSQLDFEEMQRNDPEQYQRFMDMEKLLQYNIQNSRSVPTGVITIPVVVHVVWYYNDVAQNISDSQINAQIQILNDDYRRLNTDRINTPSAWTSIAGDAQIEFKLAKIVPVGNPTSGINRISTSTNGFSLQLDNVKSTSTGGLNGWDPQKYLNIWVCNILPGIENGKTIVYLGYSTYPVNLASNPNKDGVVIDYKYFGVGGHTIFPNNLGRTATHEIGHWLNLYHIWGPNKNYSCSVDDNVSDTPNQYQETYGHPTNILTDQCTGFPNGIMYMNYMDYTNDACMNLFTNGQVTRMRAIFDDQASTGYRKQMLTQSGCNLYARIARLAVV